MICILTFRNIFPDCSCLALRLLACRIKGCLGPKGPEPHDCNRFMERVKDLLKLRLCQTLRFISQLYVKITPWCGLDVACATTSRWKTDKNTDNAEDLKMHWHPNNRLPSVILCNCFVQHASLMKCWKWTAMQSVWKSTALFTANAPKDAEALYMRKVWYGGANRLDWKKVSVTRTINKEDKWGIITCRSGENGKA